MKQLIYSVHITPPNMSQRMQDAYAMSAWMKARYAQECRADLMIKTSKSLSCTAWQSPERMEMYELFNKYDRILYIDADVLVCPNIPNIFAVYDDDDVHMFCETEYNPDYILNEVIPSIKSLRPDYEPEGNKYYNAGVMLLSKQHRDIVRYDPEEYFETVRFEQDYINYNLNRYRRSIRVQSLPLTWNGIVLYSKSDYRSHNFVHYITGTGNQEDRAQLIDDVKRMVHI